MAMMPPMASVPMVPPRPRRRAVARRAAVLLLVLAAAACESDQDPGLDPGLVGGGAETSDTLGACPPGGPDATTPEAGCLGPDGTVQRP